MDAVTAGKDRPGLQYTVVQGHSLLHADQAVAALERSREQWRRRSPAVVLDFHVQGVGQVAHRHPGRGSAGVLDGVGEGFLNDPVGRQVHAGRKRPVGSFDREFDR